MNYINGKTASVSQEGAKRQNGPLPKDSTYNAMFDSFDTLKSYFDQIKRTAQRRINKNEL